MNDFDDKPKISSTRIAVWIILGALGLYFVISGVIGGLSS